eukprot:6172849-Pleurochrysis_carterae.AAC.3
MRLSPKYSHGAGRSHPKPRVELSPRTAALSRLLRGDMRRFECAAEQQDEEPLPRAHQPPPPAPRRRARQIQKGCRVRHYSDESQKYFT